jgi:hypothetical protein
MGTWLAASLCLCVRGSMLCPARRRALMATDPLQNHVYDQDFTVAFPTVTARSLDPVAGGRNNKW